MGRTGHYWPKSSDATVTLPDGVALHVARCTVGDGEPRLTIVMLHGWILDARLWRRQVQDLPDRLDMPFSVLAYDMRGHGRSTATRLHGATVPQLADDLSAVLAAQVPTGRVVLVGHSLGGMTIMEYAYRHRDEFTRRVAGVVFVATSAEGSLHTTYGLTPGLARLIRLVEETSAGVLARSGSWRPHRVVMPVLGPAVRWLGFGRSAEAEALALTLAMIGSAQVRAVGGFRPAVRGHRRLDVLASMHRLPVSVLVGSHDRLTPRRCAEDIAAAIPQAESIVCDGAGHMLPLERADEVTDAIARICRRAAARSRRGWAARVREKLSRPRHDT
jgi:pimeloyl-ACP methyl ester carboxylesterase